MTDAELLAILRTLKQTPVADRLSGRSLSLQAVYREAGVSHWSVYQFIRGRSIHWRSIGRLKRALHRVAAEMEDQAPLFLRLAVRPKNAPASAPTAQNLTLQGRRIV